MCNLSQGIENIRIEKGVAIGIVQTIVNMVKNSKIFLEDVMAEVGLTHLFFLLLLICIQAIDKMASLRSNFT